MRELLSVLLILSITSCKSMTGFNRGELREAIGEKAVVTDADVTKALSLKAQLPKPFKIGVFFKNPDFRSSRFNNNDTAKWIWTDEDKNKILSLNQEKILGDEVSQIFVISDATVSNTDLKSLRLAAAHHGADALLVVNGINDVDEYKNSWTWTYIALVTALFVPGTVTDSLFMVRAAMWDVRNEFLYMTAESESVKSRTRPAAFSPAREITLEAKAEAIDKIRQEIFSMLAEMTNKSNKLKK